MNAEVKQLWVAALRSGAFVQGRDALFPTGGGHCCLGVLCELHARHTCCTFSRLDGYLGESETLPGAVRAWAGLSTPDPTVATSDTSVLKLSTANDDLQLSFSQLADVIEKQL